MWLAAHCASSLAKRKRLNSRLEGKTKKGKRVFQRLISLGKAGGVWGKEPGVWFEDFDNAPPHLMRNGAAETNGQLTFTLEYNNLSEKGGRQN